MNGPHFNLESLARARCALPSGPVSNTTAPSAGVGSVGYSMQGFQGDLIVLFNFGDLPNGITVALEDAPQDGVGDPPEAGDFGAVNDSDSNAVSEAIATSAEDTVHMWRVSKDLLDDYVRIQVTNGSVSDCDVAVTFLEMLPEYEDQLSERSNGSFTQFK